MHVRCYVASIEPGSQLQLVADSRIGQVRAFPSYPLLFHKKWISAGELHHPSKGHTVYILLPILLCSGPPASKFFRVG